MPSIDYGHLNRYALKCPACGYERKLSPRDLKIRGNKLVIKTVCPKCGSNMTVIFRN